MPYPATRLWDVLKSPELLVSPCALASCSFTSLPARPNPCGHPQHCRKFGDMSAEHSSHTRQHSILRCITPPPMASRTRVMLYVGAGADVRPLVFPSPWTPVVSDYVYVDGLPGSGYFEKGCAGHDRYKDIDGLLGQVETRFRMWSVAAIGARETIVRNKYYAWHIGDSVRLHYFVNTTDQDIIAGVDLPGNLQQLVQQASLMYVAGYSPAPSLYRYLPGLVAVFATEICMRHLPEAVSPMSQQIPDGDYLSDESCWMNHQRCCSCGENIWSRIDAVQLPAAPSPPQGMSPPAAGDALGTDH